MLNPLFAQALTSKSRLWIGILCLCVLLLSGCANRLLTDSFTSTAALQSLAEEVPAAAELSPQTSALACLKTAEELQNQQHVPEAIALFERARTFDPQLKEVSRRLAVLYAQSKDVAKANIEFERALAETPKDADLRSDAGYFYLQTGDLEKAEVQLNKALELSPKHPQGTIHLAMLRARQQRLDESLELFQQIVGPAAAHSNLGVLLAKAGKRDEAIEHLEQAQSMDPTLPVPPAFLKHLRKEL